LSLQSRYFNSLCTSS